MTPCKSTAGRPVRAGCPRDWERFKEANKIGWHVKMHRPWFSSRHIRNKTRSACYAFAFSYAARQSGTRCCCLGRRWRCQDRGCPRRRRGWPRCPITVSQDLQHPLRALIAAVRDGVLNLLHRFGENDGDYGDSGERRRRRTRRWWRMQPSSASVLLRPRWPAACPLLASAPTSPSIGPILNAKE